MHNKKMNFEWDQKTNQANIKKHDVAFEEAQTVFYDPLTKVAAAPEHSEQDDRFIALGQSTRRRQLVVH